jgi:hypothetical protein
VSADTLKILSGEDTPAPNFPYCGVAKHCEGATCTKSAINSITDIRRVDGIELLALGPLKRLRSSWGNHFPHRRASCRVN